MNVPNSPTFSQSKPTAPAVPATTLRVNSHELLRQARAIQIEHDGKIYELRVTRLNKLILTA